MVKRRIERFVHFERRRANNPPVGLVTAKTDPFTKAQTYQIGPHLSPQLQWASKTERSSFEVPTESLHVHERIDPLTAINAIRNDPTKFKKHSVFESILEHQPLDRAIKFYEQRLYWSNRLIAGDSLLVMHSLLRKEDMGGKVQLVYIDLPHGVKYQSNFHPFATQRPTGTARDRDIDLTREPESISAFRETWELGVHSYLSYLRARLILVRELLSESGSVIVQIDEENVHRVAMVLDELFGAESRVATITLATTGRSRTKRKTQRADYLLWYARDRSKVKHHQLYEHLSRKELLDFLGSDAGVEIEGVARDLTLEERVNPKKNLPKGARLFQCLALESQRDPSVDRSEPFEWNGRKYECGIDCHWSISHEGLQKMAELGRLHARTDQSSLMWKKYEDELPGRRISNIWPDQMYPTKKHYVGQTSEKVVERAILMTTDPGDLILDPTCGSGVSAVIAEKWGRRWITCDTSRVALNIAKHRLLISSFDYYTYADPYAGAGGGFVYDTVPEVSPKTLACKEPRGEIELYDRPKIEKNLQRITGPFTVEAVPAPVEVPIESELDGKSHAVESSVNRNGESQRLEDWRNELLASGIRGEKDKRIRFSHLELRPDALWLHAVGEMQPDGTEDRGRPVAVVFGPAHAPLEQRRVELAIEQAHTLEPQPKIIVFAAFQFDPEAARKIDEIHWPDFQLIRVQMNADLLTTDLKKKQKSNEAFRLIGQPDVELIVDRENSIPRYSVKVNRFDYVNHGDGNVISGGANEIAMWMLDTDYDGRSMYPSQIFFPKGLTNKGWDALASSLRSTLGQGLIEQYSGTVSAKFIAGEHNRVAVKIHDIRGVESLKLINLLGEVSEAPRKADRTSPDIIDRIIQSGKSIPEHLWSIEHPKER